MATARSCQPPADCCRFKGRVGPTSTPDTVRAPLFLLSPHFRRVSLVQRLRGACIVARYGERSALPSLSPRLVGSLGAHGMLVFLGASGWIWRRVVGIAGFGPSLRYSYACFLLFAAKISAVSSWLGWLILRCHGNSCILHDWARRYGVWGRRTAEFQYII